MIYQNVLLTVKQTSDIDGVLADLREHATLSRAEPGCHRFEVYQSQEDPCTIFLIEQWADATAMENHRNAEAVQTIYFPKIIPKVDRTPHPSTLVFS